MMLLLQLLFCISAICLAYSEPNSMLPPSPERYFLDTTSLEDRKSLKGFVQAATKYTETNLKSESLAQPGSPKLLVVSGAALRVTDVVR